MKAQFQPGPLTDVLDAVQQKSRHLDIEGMRQKVGGSRPVDAATIYRGVKAGLLPRPLKFGRIARWREDEVDVALQRLADARAV